MKELFATVITLSSVGVFVFYCMKPDRQERYKFSRPLFKVSSKLMDEIDACTEYRQLRAIERQFERECDFYAKHKDYSSFYKVISNLIQEKSIQLQYGIMAM